MYPCGALFIVPGYLGPGSAAHHPRVALRAPEGKLVPGPRCGADPGMLRCARDDSRAACEACAIALPPGESLARTCFGWREWRRLAHPAFPVCRDANEKMF